MAAKQNSFFYFALGAFGLLFLAGLRCSPKSTQQEDIAIHPYADKLDWREDLANQNLAFLTAAPHVFGSARQAQVRDHIIATLQAEGLQPVAQDFTAETPNPDVLTNASSMAPLTRKLSGSNIYTVAVEGTEGCIIALAGHYDTKRTETNDYVGANDSGSSTVALIQLALYLHKNKDKFNDLACGLAMYFFDGEEAMLPQWNDGEQRHPAKLKDHLYGSRHAAASLSACSQGLCLPEALGSARLKALIVLDMIGSPQVQLTLDSQSSPQLNEMVKSLDQQLFDPSIIYDGAPRPIEDDHIPFLARQIPAVDLIDFHHLSHWHKPSDLPQTLDLSSMKKVSTLALALALNLAATP